MDFFLEGNTNPEAYIIEGNTIDAKTSEMIGVMMITYIQSQLK